MADVVGLYVHYTLWIWFGLAAALLAIEVATGSGWLLWPSASAAVIGVAAKLCGLSPTAALLAFALLTIVSTLLARRYLPAQLGGAAQDINDGIGRLLGLQGRVVAPFEGGGGRVFVDGKEWAADLADGAAGPVGATVQVVGVDGARLRVRLA